MRTAGAVATLLLLAGHPGAAAPQAKDVFASEIRPLLAKYCIGCHGGAKPKAEVDLSPFRDEAAVLKSRPLWKKAFDALHAREMPPEESAQPTPAEREKLTDWIEGILLRPDPDGTRDPGHVVVRRLNRTEYNNTVTDLLSITRPRSYFNPAQGMPEKIGHRHRPEPVVAELPPDDVDYGFDNIGEVLTLPPFLMEKYLAAAAEIVEKAVSGKGGRLLTVRPGPQGRSPREAARQILAALAPRAFRRPVPDAELDRLLKLYDLAEKAGEPFESAIKVPVQAILASPHFLFRIEGRPGEPKGPLPVSDHELASRLSYFLWSSMPDKELFDLAARGALRDPKTLEAQARRMLRDPRAKSLSENFAVQWLKIGGIGAAMPDPDLFKVFYTNVYLPQAMLQEVLFLFETVLVEDRSILDLVSADFAYLNGTLARHYGLEHPGGKNARDEWVRMKLPDGRRGGVLTSGAVLTITSNSTRTSPVKRGKWVLETILGTPPPPPLPNVPDLEEGNPKVDGLTLRKRLEQHRANPACASCHRRMDPIGVGFERYDPIGAWREKEGALPIDDAAVLADGRAFKGADELKKVLLGARKDDVLRCFVEHLLTYALGRKLDYADHGTVRDIARAAAADGYRMSRIVVEIVKSYPFLYRRSGEANP